MYMSLLFQRVTEKCDKLSKELEIQTVLCQVVSYAICTYHCMLICICSVKLGLIRILLSVVEVFAYMENW